MPSSTLETALRREFTGSATARAESSEAKSPATRPAPPIERITIARSSRLKSPSISAERAIVISPTIGTAVPSAQAAKARVLTPGPTRLSPSPEASARAAIGRS